MALYFPSAWPPPSLIKSRSSASFPFIIKCHAATPSAFRISPAPALSLPKNPNATPPPHPSLTCTLQCPHFESKKILLHQYIGDGGVEIDQFR
ncbi:hypothetical protein LguiA_026103 [Lonicera macranthoides]